MRNLKKYFYLFLQHKKLYILYFCILSNIVFTLNSRSESFNVSIKLKD